MLKILLVDDEDITRKGMMKIINRAQAGFEVVGEARNGLEALYSIENNPPHVVITDIQMPLMDGRELVTKLENKYPQIRKIVLSGYNDFNYVRSTMKCGAADYLLKPVDSEELINLLKKIEDDIQQEKEKRQNEIDLKIKLRESLPLLKDEFICEILTGKKFSKKEFEDRLNYFDICLEKGKYSVLIISVDNYRSIVDKLGIEDAKLKAFIIRNIAEEIISSKTSYISYEKEGNFIAAVSVPDDDVSKLKSIVEELYRALLRYTGFRFTISMGEAAEDVSLLKESYIDAKNKLRFRFYKDKSSCIDTSYADEYIQYIDNEKSNMHSENLISSLKNCIELTNINEVSKIINNFYAVLIDFKLEPGEAVKLFTEVCIKVQMNVPECDKSLVELYGNEYSFVKALGAFDTLDAMKSYAIDIFESMVKNIEKIRRTKDVKTVEIVKAYIQKHYNEDISLNKIVEVTYLSPSYVCDLFKKQTGENIINYLTRVRIEKAKLLLKDIKVKTYEVGQQVGYEDPTYFSKVFKKAVGVSPSEYRNMV